MSERPATNRDGVEKGDRSLLGFRKFEYVQKGEKIRVVAVEDAWYHGDYIKKGTELLITTEGERLGRWMKRLKDGESAPPPPQKANKKTMAVSELHRRNVGVGAANPFG